MKSYILLTLSIVFEVFATTMLKLSEGFSIIWPAVISILGYGLSFFSLGLTLKSVSLSIAYAIWAGAGTILTTIISVIAWDEPLGLLKISALTLIIGGIIILNLSESNDESSPNAQ